MLAFTGAPCIGNCFDLAGGRRSLCQCKMSSIILVVTDLLIQKAFHIPLIESEHGRANPI